MRAVKCSMQSLFVEGRGESGVAVNHTTAFSFAIAFQQKGFFYFSRSASRNGTNEV